MYQAQITYGDLGICVYNVRKEFGGNLMRSTTMSSKDARIDLRLNQIQKVLLEKAAQLQGRSLSEFVIAASTDAAETTLANDARLFLSEVQMDQFLVSLEEEPRIIPELKALFARKSVVE
jgi:uncharacterized protein (DUF1778 family)